MISTYRGKKKYKDYMFNMFNTRKSDQNLQFRVTDRLVQVQFNSMKISIYANFEVSCRRRADPVLSNFLRNQRPKN